MAFHSIRHPLLTLYRDDRESTYKAFADAMETLIAGLMRAHGLVLHVVTSRAKSVHSLAEKLRRKNDKYRTLSEITDLVGVRVIAYVPSDVDRVANVLRNSFVVDAVNSLDRRKPPGPDVFGYGSLHLVLSLPPARLALPEYSAFQGLRFEVQVRTILQHAWAEIEHDIGYKATKVLPAEVERGLYRVAALLEQADAVFDQTTTIVRDMGGSCESATEELTVSVLSDMLHNDSQVLRLEHLLDDLNTAGIDRDEPMAVDLRVAYLQSCGIGTKKELRTAIDVHYPRFRLVLPAMLKWGGEPTNETYTRGASLSFFAEFLACQGRDLAEAQESLVELRGDPHEEDNAITREYAAEICNAIRLLDS